MGTSSLAPASSSASNYVSLAGEFFVLAELALRRLDGTLTLGHTKAIDVLVLNRATGKTFKVEVKTTEGGVRRSVRWGDHYSWLMHARHADVRDDALVYAFVLLPKSTVASRPRTFLVPSADVAQYIHWNHDSWWRSLTVAQRRRAKTSALRQFRFPACEPQRSALPEAWADRWRRWENNWGIFGPSPSP